MRHRILLAFLPATSCTGLRKDGGVFGNWTLDEWGLPVFDYTLDQVSSEGAKLAADYFSHVGKAWSPREATDSLFQLGNDKLVLLASPYGYVQMRQDEGAPKLLNDFAPTDQQWGGAIGYLIDERGSVVASTWFDGDSEESQVSRTFGIGHRTFVAHSRMHGITLKQTLRVPFGTEPLVVSSVEVQNLDKSSKHLRYIEVWGAQPLQLPMFVDKANGGYIPGSEAIPLRRDYQRKHYSYSFKELPNTAVARGIVMKTSSLNISRVKPALWDASPPTVFLAALDMQGSQPIATGCNASAFFGDGGVRKPSLQLVCRNGTVQEGMVLIVERSITVAPGEKVKLHHAFGYVHQDERLESLLQKYSAPDVLQSLPEQNAAAWKKACGSFVMPTRPAVGREVFWNCGYLRQAMTFYDFFDEFVLDQGDMYRYELGFNGAARDSLQHALPFIYSDPKVIKSVLRGVLKQLMPPEAWGPPQPTGPFNPSDDAFNLPYGLTGGAVIGDHQVKKHLNLGGASDMELYLLLTSSLYLLGTRDMAFLNEDIPFYYKTHRNTSASRTVLQALCDSYLFVRDHIGVGEHGLLRVQSGDWNDGFTDMAQCGDNATCFKDVCARGESVSNAGLAKYVLPMFADILELSAASSATANLRCPSPQEVRRFAQSQGDALEQAWNGKWFNRAWLPRAGWIGNVSGENSGIMLEAQFWPMLAGLDSDRLTQLLDGLHFLSSPTGACQMQPYCAVWPALSHPLVMALANSSRSSTMAWREWLSLSMANQANRFPSFWPGIWSSADHINFFGAGKGCSGSASFPTLNLHRHAWPLFSLAHGLLGLRFCKEGLVVSPAVPPDEGEFTYNSTLLTLRRDAVGNLAGSYLPLQDTMCDIWLSTDLSTDNATAGARSGQVAMRVGKKPWAHALFVEEKGGFVRYSLDVESNYCGPRTGELKWELKRHGHQAVWI